MRFYTTVSIFALSASVLSAPTPQVGARSATDLDSGNGSNNGNELIGHNALLSGNVLALDGVTDGILKEKRQDGATGLTGELSDIAKVRVVGNARRQLGGDLSSLSAVPDAAGLVTKPVNSVANGIDVFDNKKAKRDIPVVSDLPLAGGLTDPLSHTPVLEGALSAVDGVVPDTSGVDGALFSAVKPVSDATNVLDVKRDADVVDETLTAVLAGDGSTNSIDSFNDSENGNSGIGHNSVLSGNGIDIKREADAALTGILAGDDSKSAINSGNGSGNKNSGIGHNSVLSGNGIVL